MTVTTLDVGQGNEADRGEPEHSIRCASSVMREPISWHPSNPAEVQKAGEAFRQAVNRGDAVYTLAVDGTTEGKATEFDPDVSYLAVPQLVGG